MQKIVGIDFGHARIGLSSADVGGMIAFPKGNLQGSYDLKAAAQTVATALKDFSIATIVVGHPLMMNGTKGEMALKVEEFASHLEKLLNVPIVLFDERLTSKSIESQMREHKVKRKKRAQVVDSLAASMILQNYLDQQQNMLGSTL